MTEDQFKEMRKETAKVQYRERRERMKRLLMHQAAFLMSSHIKAQAYEKMIAGPYETRMQ